MEDSRPTNLTTMDMVARSEIVDIARCCFCETRQARERLIDSDYSGSTVLLHAAGAGTGATFDALVQAIEASLSQDEVSKERAFHVGWC